MRDSKTLRFLPKPSKAYSDALTAAIPHWFSCYLYMVIKTSKAQAHVSFFIPFPCHVQMILCGNLISFVLRLVGAQETEETGRVWFQPISHSATLVEF